MRGMWLQAQRKSRADDGSSLKSSGHQRNHVENKITAGKKKHLLVVSLFAQEGADTLQYGGPVGLMSQHSQEIGSVSGRPAGLRQVK